MGRKSWAVAFMAGLLAGAAVSWHYAKNKYEKIAQEEIDSVKEVFRKKENPQDCGEKDRGQREKITPIDEYARILREEGYSRGNGGEPRTKEDKNMGQQKAYVIPPDEFGGFPDYERISLTYYADGILADDNDETIEDAEEIVGDALKHFGEYEEDAVFVRCDGRRCDYEIALDQRNFIDVVGDIPQQTEE